MSESFLTFAKKTLHDIREVTDVSMASPTTVQVTVVWGDIQNDYVMNRLSLIADLWQFIYPEMSMVVTSKDNDYVGKFPLISKHAEFDGGFIVSTVPLKEGEK